jgi:hypothetical protein
MMVWAYILDRWEMGDVQKKKECGKVFCLKSEIERFMLTGFERTRLWRGGLIEIVTMKPGERHLCYWNGTLGF